MLLANNGEMDQTQFYAWLNPQGMTHAEKYSRERLLSQCVEVTQEVYGYFLDMLPPMHFTSTGYAMSEATTEDLRLAFFRLHGPRWFAAYVSDDDKARTMRATRELIEDALV